MFGIVGVVVVRKPGELLDSLMQLPRSGTIVREYTIDPGPDDPTLDVAEIKPQPIDVSINRDQVRKIELLADVNAVVSAHEELF